MPTTTLTSREFHQDSAKVKRAVEAGPVIVTDRGKPSLVLLTYGAYQELSPKPRRRLLDALAMPEDGIELELPERPLYKVPDIEWD